MQATKGAVDVGVISTQPEAVLAFYTDVLGLEYVEVFETPDLDEVWERVVRTGTPIVSPRSQHPNGAEAGTVQDPDGNLIEVLRRPS